MTTGDGTDGLFHRSSRALAIIVGLVATLPGCPKTHSSARPQPLTPQRTSADTRSEPAADPDVSRYVLLDPQQKLYVAPDLGAPAMLGFDTEQDAVRASKAGVRLVFEVVDFDGSSAWVEIRTVPDELDGHCGATLRSLRGYALRFFVPRSALLPVLTRPTEALDRSARAELSPGLAVTPTADGLARFVSGGIEATLPVPADAIGRSYTPAPLPNHDAPAEVNLNRFALRDSISTGMGEIDVDSCDVPDVVGAQRGDKPRVTFRTRCAQVEVTMPAGALEPPVDEPEQAQKKAAGEVQLDDQTFADMQLRCAPDRMRTLDRWETVAGRGRIGLLGAATPGSAPPPRVHLPSGTSVRDPSGHRLGSTTRDHELSPSDEVHSAAPDQRCFNLPKSTPMMVSERLPGWTFCFPATALSSMP